MGRPERPIDPEAGPVQRFAWELRRLRQQAGGVSYRQLARRANYSATALSAAAAGEQLPSRAVALAYVEACGGDREEWAARWAAAAEQLRPEPASSNNNVVAPYLGLAAFQPEDADRFFGREQLVDELLARLDRGPFLALFGGSGTGKSSLLRAGLLAAVRAGRLPGDWAPVLLTPGRRPLAELAVQIAALHRISPGSLLADLVADPESLDLAVRQAVVALGGDARVLLVVDQFEEIFTLCADEHERVAFVAALLGAAGGARGRTRVVLGIRADFYGHCADFPQLLSALPAAQLLIGPMSRDELREAIVGPAGAAGLTVEPALLAAVIADVEGRPGALPLMSHALLETWHRRRGATLTLAGYQAAGGVRCAIAQTAEQTYAELDPAQRRIARGVFLRLTALGHGSEDTGRRVHPAELSGVDSQRTRVVLDRLAGARLVTFGSDTVEVAHEALIREWPRLRQWLTEDRGSVRQHRRLTEAAAEWMDSGRDPSCLYRGSRLAVWQDRPQADLNEVERDFLAASRERQAHEVRGHRRRVRAVIGGLSLILAVISGLAVVAAVQRDQAREQRDLALSRQLAASAATQLAIDPELGLLLARRAYAIRPTEEAETALRQSIVDSRIRATLRGHDGAVTGVAIGPDGRQVASAGTDGTVRIWRDSITPEILRGHTGAVHEVAFGPNGTRVASAGADGTVRIWGHAPEVLRGHTGAVHAVAFGPNGDRVASAGADGTIRVWHLGSGAPPVVLRGHDGGVSGVVFSRDGRQLASAGRDGTIAVWEPESPSPVAILRGHEGPVTSVALHPDGRRLASAGEDNTVRIWDRSAGAATTVLRDHDGAVHHVAFSPDGQVVASAGADETVRVRDASGEGQPVVLRGHKRAVLGVAFSPDGRRLSSVGIDGTARIWEWAREEATLRGNEGSVGGADFGAEAAWVAAGDSAGVVRVWNPRHGADPVVLSGHSGPVNNVAAAPDGRRLASVSADGTVRLWHLASAAPVVLSGHRGAVFDVAFSPDGRRVASAGADATVRIWDPAGIAAPAVLPMHDGPAIGVAFSPDGRWIASAGNDGTIKIRDLRGDPVPHTLHGHHGAVHAVAFGSDGRRIFSAGFDGTVRVWDLAGGGDPIVLRGHEGAVFRIAPSQDARWLASAGNDGTVRIWNLHRDSDPIVLRGHENEVNSVRFSPDGRTIVTASDDGTVRVWPCEACGPIDHLLALADNRSTRELTPEERRVFLHEP